MKNKVIANAEEHITPERSVVGANEVLTQSIELSNESITYKSNNSVFIYPDGYSSRTFYLSTDNGTTYAKLYSTGFGSFAEEHKASAENSSGELSWKVAGSELTMNDTNIVFSKVNSPESISIIIAPADRETEYLVKFPDDIYVYVSANKFNNSYREFKLYIGTPNRMEEAKINYVDRRRDGGTTFIQTDNGMFFSPAPLKNKAPKWEENEGASLDGVKLIVIENEDGTVALEGLQNG